MLEDNFGESVLTFYHVSFGDFTEVLWLGSKHLYPLSHLSHPLVPREVFEIVFLGILAVRFNVLSYMENPDVIKELLQPNMVLAHSFDLSTWEAEVSRSL